MKHFNKIVVATLMMLGLSSNAQDSNNPWAISFGVNAIDTKTSAGGGKNWFDSHFSQPFAVNDNWNIVPSISYLGLSKYIGDNFTFGVSGSVNRINKYVNFNPAAPGRDSRGYVVTNPGDLVYYGLDATVRYTFQSLIKSKTIEPSLAVGGGYSFFGDASYGTIDTGAGLTFWFTETVGLELATKYRKSFGARETARVPDAPSFFQHTAGLVFKFGGTDTDKDGIYDKEDACPDVAGLKQFNGCPDTDGDGIVDGSDACPEVAGLATLNGCPDADGDGLTDANDACPQVAGLASLKGCPDADKDGVADKDDKCPSVAGPKENAGCPWADTDKDGVADKDDACPEVAGPASNKGCPEVTAADLDKVSADAKMIYFNSGKSTFRSEDVPVKIESISTLLKQYPTAKFSIEGHTDSDGSDAFNQKLSQERADVVRNALIERGMKPENLTAVGYGETKPVATNKTAAGKAKNRRTEVVLQK
jgi:outer membrane protein OmpA-like peptidoglycan-associated protein